jgi:hypothetical protein
MCANSGRQSELELGFHSPLRAPFGSTRSQREGLELRSPASLPPCFVLTPEYSGFRRAFPCVESSQGARDLAAASPHRREAMRHSCAAGSRPRLFGSLACSTRQRLGDGRRTVPGGAPPRMRPFILRSVRLGALLPPGCQRASWRGAAESDEKRGLAHRGSQSELIQDDRVFELGTLAGESRVGARLRALTWRSGRPSSPMEMWRSEAQHALSMQGERRKDGAGGPPGCCARPDEPDAAARGCAVLQ